MPISEKTPQLPAAGEVFLDHVGWFTSDMTAATSAFERLGFPLTPFSVHGDRDPETGVIKAIGSANHLAMLERGYLEILTPVAGIDSPVARHITSSLERYTGVHLVAFTVADAETDRARLAEAGFTVMPTVNLRRTVELEDGSETEVAFTVLRGELGSIPEGRMQVLTHHTPEAMWQGRYVAKNGFGQLDEVLFAVSAPAESAGRLASFTGRRAREDGGIWTVALDRGRLRFMTHDRASAELGGAAIGDGVTIAAIGFQGDPQHVLARTSDTGVPARKLGDGRVIIPADAAVGCCLIVSA